MPNRTPHRQTDNRQTDMTTYCAAQKHIRIRALHLPQTTLTIFGKRDALVTEWHHSNYFRFCWNEVSEKRDPSSERLMPLKADTFKQIHCFLLQWKTKHDLGWWIEHNYHHNWLAQKTEFEEFTLGCKCQAKTVLVRRTTICFSQTENVMLCIVDLFEESELQCCSCIVITELLLWDAFIEIRNSFWVKDTLKVFSVNSHGHTQIKYIKFIWR